MKRLPRFTLCFVCALVTAALAMALVAQSAFCSA
jgi:hypothetical protein